MTLETIYTNIAYYKFVEIQDPQSLRTDLLKVCLDLGIKGTIILGTEGINSCLVGSDDSISQYIQYMKQDSRFSDIDFKKSYSTHVPFRRMLIKMKKEIIPIGIPSVKPHESTGKYVSPMELKKWLDEGQDIILLDTRNDYEMDLGTFRHAVKPDLQEFRQFPNWVREHFSTHKKKKVVTFCTGGIRCEKATAFMQQEGFEDVYQIQGGILKYLEETATQAPNQDNYYDGDCFVFDYRVAVDKALQPTQYMVCYHCWSTLKPEELEHPHYKQNVHCPHCKEEYDAKQQKQSHIMQKNNAKALSVRQERSQKIRESLNLQ